MTKSVIHRLYTYFKGSRTNGDERKGEGHGLREEVVTLEAQEKVKEKRRVTNYEENN